MSIIAEIKDKIDILDLVQREGVVMRKAGRVWKGLCPFHDEKTPSFMVYPDEGRWQCYGACGIGGDVLDFYQRKHHVDLKDAIDALAERAGIERQYSPSTKYLDRLYGVLKVATETYQRLLPKSKTACAYLEQRGISQSDIDRWQIGYAPAKGLLKYLTQLGYEATLLQAAGLIDKSETGQWYDRFRKRLIFPIHDERGRVVGFGGRALDDTTQPKYINSPETAVFRKSDLFYGMHRAKDAIRKQQQAIVVEGYTDVIAAHRAGHIQTVGSMGTALTQAQMSQLRYAQRIILALDNDEAGKQAIVRGAQHAGALRDIRVAHFPEGQDADDAIATDSWDASIAEAEPVTDYIIRRSIATLPDDASNIEKIQLVKRVLPLLLATESDLLKRSSVQSLALELGMDYHILLDYAQPEPPKAQPPLPPKSSPTREMTILATFIAHPDWYDEIEIDLIFLDEPLTATDFGTVSQVFTLFLEARKQGEDVYEYIHALGSDVLPESETLGKSQLWRQILNLRILHLTEGAKTALNDDDRETYEYLHKRKVNVLREFLRGKV